MIKHQKGQTILEYTVIVIIMLGVMISMKDYIKRGVQGRWKTATDQLGDQYDPQNVNSLMNFSSQVNSESIVTVANGTFEGADGQWTSRTDLSNALETKTGFTQVGN